ncbi:MAG: FAD-binding domain-containing protein [Ahrensia sp.]|nr:FAD-binding domain-containing protein [Ahrensia sp.]
MTDLLTRSIEFSPLREAGLSRLEAFVPFAASKYTNERNFDYGANNRSNVSALSPWVRNRLITEEEICARVMRDFAFSSTEKFIQEVFWRTYWKGWLELRPSVWHHFTSKRDNVVSNLKYSEYQAAINGTTGIDCFDAWAHELVETGYLHNHARMWFASIWIFTLKLDWTVGADFFLRHLMDADAASNTLSWRWVAGLQTKGKNYIARASNISTFTNGRFAPKGLNENAHPLPDDISFDKPMMPPMRTTLPSGKNAMLLINEDDCAPEQLSFHSNKITNIATWNLSAARSPLELGSVAAHFTSSALADAATRASEKFNAPSTSFEGKQALDKIVNAATDAKVDCVIAPYTNQGWARGPMDQLAAKLRSNNIGFYEIQRDWDTRAWPHASKGFFAFKEKIPQLMRDAGFDLQSKR